MTNETSIKDAVEKILVNDKKWILKINNYYYKHKDVIFKYCAAMFYIEHFDNIHNTLPKYDKKYYGAEKVGYIDNQENLYNAVNLEYSKNNKFYIDEFEEYFIDVSLSFSIKILESIIKEIFPENTPKIDIMSLREELLVSSFYNSYMEFYNFIYNAWNNELNMALIDFLMLGRNSLDDVYMFSKQNDINNTLCEYHEKNNHFHNKNTTKQAKQKGDQR